MDHLVDNLGKRIPDGGNNIFEEAMKLSVLFGEPPEIESVCAHACVHACLWNSGR